MSVVAEILLGSNANSEGIPILASGPVSWELREGTQPVTKQFQIAPIHHGTLMNYVKGGLGNTVSLRITDGAGVEVIFRQLFVLNTAPGPNPHIKSVTIADRRWLWHYCHIGPRRYNWRRNVGRVRLTNPGEVADLGDPIDPQIVYALYSLKNDTNLNNSGFVGVPWKADEVVRNIMADVFAFEADARGESGLALPDVPGPGAIPVENLLIDDPGDQAINKALSYIPQLAIYINKDGNAQLKIKTSGKEEDVVQNNVMGFEKVDQGHVALVENSLIRPKNIYVQFEREVEVRFDFFEQETATGLTEVSGHPEILSTRRFMYNVLPVTDWTIGDYVMGEWISFDEALDLWDDEDRPSGVNLDINQEIIRKAMVPFLDLWSGFLLLGKYDPNNYWMGRISAIQQHYRRTFQISQSWLDATYQIRAERVGILNPSTGTKAPALVLGNHTRLGSQKSMRMNKLENEQLSYAMPMICYPAATPDEAAATSLEPAIKYPIIEYIDTPLLGSIGIVNSPATLQVVDSDQGIISIDYIPDNNRMYEMMLPSLLEMSTETEANSGPGANPTLRSRPITFDMLQQSANVSLENFPQLSKNHKCLVILTAIPGGWQAVGNQEQQGPGAGFKNRQLEEVKVSPNGQLAQELKSMVSDKCKESINDCQGPDMYIRIGAGTATAKIVWKDSEYLETAKIFGFVKGKVDTKKLCINKTENQGGASLTNIALAASARVYESLTDRLQGDKTSTLAPAVTPEGWIDTVGYSVAPSGEVSTRVDLPESIPQIDLLSFMDSATRAVVLKLR